MTELGPLRRAAPAALFALALGLTCAGCPSAEIVGYEVAPDAPNELMVRVSVSGFSHVMQHCRVEAVTNRAVGEAGVPMDPEAYEPQDCLVRIDRWRKNEMDPREDPQLPPPGLMRLRFYYHQSVQYQEFKPEPRGFDPLAEEQPAPRPTAAPSPEPRPSPPAATPLPPGLSKDVRSPTLFKPRAGKDIKEFGIRGADQSQFLRLEGLNGPVRLRIDVEAMGAARARRDPASWSFALLDARGEALDEPLEETQFIEPGSKVRTSVVWTFDGSPRILQVTTSYPEGLRFKVTFTPEDEGWAAPRDE